MNSRSKTAPIKHLVEMNIRPSLLDRLTDETAHVNRFSLNQLLESIRRDLENLINTPRTPLKVGPGFKEINKSILNFGIYDISSISGSDRQVWESVIEDVERAIETFEPRLRNVRVVLRNVKLGKPSQVEFEIHGLLRIDPSPALVFQSAMQFSSGRTLIDFPELNDTVDQ
ncbi:MAG: type VI secretion system baseplate subunit TssE [bacterium]